MARQNFCQSTRLNRSVRLSGADIVRAGTSAHSKIADLEHALGVRLLDRGPQGVEPILYGKAFVRRALNVFDELRQGVGEVEFMADARLSEVRLGCPETLAATLLPGVVERFSEQYPGIRLHVVQTNPLALEVLACATDQQQKDERQKTRAV